MGYTVFKTHYLDHVPYLEYVVPFRLQLNSGPYYPGDGDTVFVPDVHTADSLACN